MIISFKHKGLETFFHTGSGAGIQAIHRKRLREVLTVLNVATGPEDLQRSSWRTHRLQGDRKEFYAIWVQANWRLTFRFIDTTSNSWTTWTITDGYSENAQPRITW